MYFYEDLTNINYHSVNKEKEYVQYISNWQG